MFRDSVTKITPVAAIAPSPAGNAPGARALGNQGSGTQVATAVVPIVNDNDRGYPPAERSGPAILDLLQQAADSARRNEDRAQASAARLTEEVRRLQQRNAALETQVGELQERANRAEQWLMHIYEQIHAQFIQPAATPIAPASERRARHG